MRKDTRPVADMRLVDTRLEVDMRPVVDMRLVDMRLAADMRLAHARPVRPLAGMVRALVARSGR